jgi:uncharacterized protein (TIGR03437 family)
LIPATPDVGHGKQFPVGSLVHLNGYLPGSADDLRGQILLDGRPVPVVKTNPNDVAIQIPWEQHTGDVPFRVDIPSGSPFITYELATAVPVYPAFEPLDPGESAFVPIKLIKGDFSGLITVEPQPGDIVIAYMTGLGPVKGQPQTETPAPLDMLMPLNGSITCTFQERRTSLVPPTPQGPAETLFAGLAPGLIGTYQVTFRMPARAGQGPLQSINCDLATAQGGGSLSVLFIGNSVYTGFLPR